MNNNLHFLYLLPSFLSLSPSFISLSTPNKRNQDQTTKNVKKDKTKENEYNTPNKWNQDQTTENEQKKTKENKYNSKHGHAQTPKPKH